MATATRLQRIYDHRLKDLVHQSGDIQLAVRHGVPRSTARGWLRRSCKSVVTLDVLKATGRELRQEIIALRRLNEKLRAVLRILVAVRKVTSFSLANYRILDPRKRKKVLFPFQSWLRAWLTDPTGSTRRGYRRTKSCGQLQGVILGLSPSLFCRK